MRGHFERLAMIQPILRGLRRPLQPAHAGRSIVVIRRARRVASPHPKRGPERLAARLRVAHRLRRWSSWSAAVLTGRPPR